MTRAAIYEMQVQVQVPNCGSRDQLSPGLSILKLGIVKCGVATRCQMLQGCFGFRIFPLERYFALCGPCVCVWHMENVPERQKGNRQPAGGSRGREADDGNRIDRSVSWSKSLGDSKKISMNWKAVCCDTEKWEGPKKDQWIKNDHRGFDTKIQSCIQTSWQAT